MPFSSFFSHFWISREKKEKELHFLKRPKNVLTIFLDTAELLGLIRWLVAALVRLVFEAVVKLCWLYYHDDPPKCTVNPYQKCETKENPAAR